VEQLSIRVATLARGERRLSREPLASPGTHMVAELNRTMASFVPYNGAQICSNENPL
jgi:hypothetical protein